MVIISSRDLAKILSTSLTVYISYNEIYSNMKFNLFWENKMTKKKPNAHNIGGTYKQKRRKENKGKS